MPSNFPQVKAEQDPIFDTPARVWYYANHIHRCHPNGRTLSDGVLNYLSRNTFQVML